MNSIKILEHVQKAIEILKSNGYGIMQIECVDTCEFSENGIDMFGPIPSGKAINFTLHITKPLAESDS